MDLTTIQSWLSGKKTYVVAIAALVSLISLWSQGKIDNATFAQDATGVVLAITIRAGMKKDPTVTTDVDLIPENVKHDLENAGIKLQTKKKT